MRIVSETEFAVARPEGSAEVTHAVRSTNEGDASVAGGACRSEKQERLIGRTTRGGTRRRMSKVRKVATLVCESIVTVVETKLREESTLVDAL